MWSSKDPSISPLRGETLPRTNIFPISNSFPYQGKVGMGSFISNPNDVVKLHQHVKVKVTEVDIARKRIQLTMKDIEL